MRTLLLTGIIFFLNGCMTENKWKKEKLVNDCLRDFTKKNEQQKLFTQVQIGLLCDCVADKLMVKYKSMKEADNDPEGAQQIGKDCGTEVMSK